MSINLKKLFQLLFISFLFIVFSHIFGVYMGLIAPVTEGYPTNFLLDLFFFGYEKNITALYSSYLFVIVGLFFHVLAKEPSQLSKSWKWLRNLAIYFACDEWFAIHDALLNPLGIGPLNIPYWVWIYGLFCIIILIRLLPFIKRIPKQLMTSLIIGASVFITGAALMEVVTYQNQVFYSIPFQIGMFFEDGLEMSGLLITIYGFIHYFKSKSMSYVTFPKVFTLSAFFIGLIDFLAYYFLSN